MLPRGVAPLGADSTWATGSRMGGRRVAHGDHRDECGELLLGEIALDDPKNRARLILLLVAHSGMFPCFLGGSDSRLVRSRRSALATSARVLLGRMTAST